MPEGAGTTFDSETNSLGADRVSRGAVMGDWPQALEVTWRMPMAPRVRWTETAPVQGALSKGLDCLPRSRPVRYRLISPVVFF